MDRGTVHVHAGVSDLEFPQGRIPGKSVSPAAAATANVQDSNTMREEAQPREFT